MPKSDKLVKGLKRKFYLFTSLGIVFIAIISFYSFDLHRVNVNRQSSIQKMYSGISTQLTLVNKVSHLGEKFDDNLSSQDSIELQNQFKELLRELADENNSFQAWISESNNSSLTKVEGLLKEKNHSQKMKTFLDQARELFQNKDLAQVRVKEKIKSLTENSIAGIGEILINAANQLQREQEISLARFNKMGIALIVLCVVQVVFVWIFVFRPLYATVLEQHEKISDAILKAQSASRSKTDFLANISHEIRTPMTAILGYADILKRSEISEFEKEDAVKIIDKNAHHLISLIDEILDISKIEAGKFTYEKEKVDFTGLLNEVYSLLNVKAQEKEIDLIFKSEGKIPEVIYSDPKRLKQILFNLLGNSIKFTDYGYVKLVVFFDEKDNLVKFQIEDSGCGIRADLAKKLFKPFQQADSSVNRKYGGTGLGLVLSRGLAQGMGGDIKILRTEVGKGTLMEAFIDIGAVNDLELTSNFSTSVVQDKPQEIPKDVLTGKRILVVDDAKENSRLFDLYLSEAGATVSVANNGSAAIDLTKEKEFDIVLLDLQMPGKDGFQVIKELRELSFSKPIAALTAHAMKEEKEKTKLAGFDAHITKPVKPDELIQTVFSLIQG